MNEKPNGIYGMALRTIERNAGECGGCLVLLKTDIPASLGRSFGRAVNLCTLIYLHAGLPWTLARRRALAVGLDALHDMAEGVARRVAVRILNQREA